MVFYFGYFYIFYSHDADKGNKGIGLSLVSERTYYISGLAILGLRTGYILSTRLLSHPFRHHRIKFPFRYYDYIVEFLHFTGLRLKRSGLGHRDFLSINICYDESASESHFLYRIEL